MGRTKKSAGRMAREPSVPKLIAVETSPPTTTKESTPSTHHLVTLFHPPSQPDRSPSLRPANRPPESTKNNPSSSPPSKPDTKNKANKPRPKPQPIPTRTRPLTLRSGKKFAPPLTRALAKLGIPENTLTVGDPPSSEEVASGEDSRDVSEPDSPEPEHTPQKQHEPPVVRLRTHETDQPEPSRRRAVPRDFVFPAPKRKKARMASGPPSPSLPPDNLHFQKAKMQLRNRPKFDKAAKNKKKTKPRQEKTAKKKKKTEHRNVDEAIEDVVSSHSNGDVSSLHTSVDFFTTAVLVNSTMLKEQQAQLNRLQRTVQTILDGGL